MTYAACVPVVRSDGRTTCSVQVRHRCRTAARRRRTAILDWSVAYAIVIVLAALFGSARG